MDQALGFQCPTANNASLEDVCIILSAFLLSFPDATTFFRVLHVQPLEFVTERMLVNGSNKIQHLEKELPRHLPPPSPGQQFGSWGTPTV